ncbi:MAG: LON peptidase substrate-binding domain-containing protein [Saprospiraceae bacterium]
MTDFLPLFPLKLVAFPGEELNLHIFEPRYKQLIRECEQNGTTFGLPAYLDNKVMDFGTEIELIKITKKGSDGSMDIKTRGLGVFKIHEYYSIISDKLYSGGDIKRISGNENGDPLLYFKILELTQQLFEYLSIKKDIPKDKSDFSTYEMAHHVGFSIEQEYKLLTIEQELDRQEFMINHLENLIPIVKDMERLRKRVEMNGHFKNIIPPV